MVERPKSPSERARSERLKKALRENLKRRKAQLRERSAKRADNSRNSADPASDR
jgi:hypothetical protein